ncbi:efflux RND transporter periplasmic adaptor subunit [Maribacter sp. CXY002]|uniref:efflux RND transporter periplasmic adaptor subunit n=1 Tax=Maribacter luteocoastalis TaxID=3407671 RepID=UPI003B66DC59
MLVKVSRAITLGIIILTLFLSCGSSEQKILPTVTTITESVYSSVTIQPDSLYQAYAIVAGILDKNLVNEGDVVQKGQGILQIINTTPKLNTDNARLGLELAKKNYSGSATVLNGIRDEINAAKLRLKNDSLNYFRQKRLWKEHIGSQTEYDNRKLAYELSSNALALLNGKLERTKNELLTQLETAENNYRTALVTNRDFTVTSKINGKVYALFKKTGELVSTMEPLASIGSADDFVIELLVDEVDIVNVEIEQQVFITLDAYGTEIFKAKVSKIYPRKDERSQTFKVEAKFDTLPKILYPGLSGEGNIVIAHKVDAMVIPKSYLIEGNKLRTEAGLIEVKTGLMSLDTVEIIGGLNSSTYIIRPE